MLKCGVLSAPIYMLSTNPPDPYSIAKSLIFVITVNPKLDHLPRLTASYPFALVRCGSAAPVRGTCVPGRRERPFRRRTSIPGTPDMFAS